MERNKKNTWLIPLAVIAVGMGALPTAAAPSAPRLVVGIIVEGLSTDELEYQSNSFGSGGFNKLAREGVSIDDIDYGGAGSTASLAMLFTGTTPRVNGVDAASTFSRDSRRQTSIFHDPQFIGNFTTETLSPKALMVSTLADELKASTAGRARIHSIAPTAESAIIAGGHSAGSAVWINETDGRWSTSTFYKDIPQALTDRNYRVPLSRRLDSISWSGGNGSFSYTFPKKDIDRYRKFKSSPGVNREITSLAIDYIDWMGRTRGNTDATTDMLTLVYTVAPYPYGNDASTLSDETTEAYRSLDAQISRVIREIDLTYGLANTLVYVAGIPSEQLGRAVDTRWGIPTGEFSPRRAKALLNMYLMALHGNGEWVSGYDNFRFWLNTPLATEKSIDHSTLRSEAAEFLTRMSGVTSAVSIERIIDNPETAALFHPSTSPDVVIEVNPGWKITESDNEASDGKTVSYSGYASPLFILHPSLKALNRSVPVRVSAVAPTLSRLMRIRAPDGAAEAPLRFK